MDLNTMALMINNRCTNYGYCEIKWPYPESMTVHLEPSETKAELIKKTKSTESRMICWEKLKSRESSELIQRKKIIKKINN
jgi:hypothetical protein